MKILHLGQMIGGLDIYIRNSIMYIESDFEYVLVRGNRDDSKPIDKKGKKVVEYGISLYRDLNLYYDLKAIIQAVAIIKKERPDLIHCHSAKGGVVGRISGFLTHTNTFYTPHAFSFLSTQSRLKKKIYLLIERATKLNAWLLACSESERMMGINLVCYNKKKALVWNNSVPDALNELEKNEI
ncbi:glycosyltransferase [Phocaeicola sartorii]|uniref:glycosyltransferase n=1 Tax=Phocaeicola sartorii TaxID=671267 RepID=UPI001F57BE58|nr:glycosyltransferase [Phocaeicola sartorii]